LGSPRLAGDGFCHALCTSEPGVGVNCIADCAREPFTLCALDGGAAGEPAWLAPPPLCRFSLRGVRCPPTPSAPPRARRSASPSAAARRCLPLRPKPIRVKKTSKHVLRGG
jgi:hypothetical protein